MYSHYLCPAPPNTPNPKKKINKITKSFAIPYKIKKPSVYKSQVF